MSTVDVISDPGTVTAFRFAGGPGGVGSALLQVLRPSGGGTYTVVGQVQAIANGTLGQRTVPASIPAQAGDVLGLYLNSAEGQNGFPCQGAASLDSMGVGFPTTPPQPGDTITTYSESPGYRLNIEAEVTPPPVAPLLDGHGVSGRKTRFDFTVNGTADAPTGTATLTSSDGKYIRAGDISCFRQVAPNRVVFGVRDDTSKTPATTYREFYAEDNEAIGPDRLTEIGKASATAPPAGCRTKSPVAGSGVAIRSGDIAVGGYEPPR